MSDILYKYPWWERAHGKKSIWESMRQCGVLDDHLKLWLTIDNGSFQKRMKKIVGETNLAYRVEKLGRTEMGRSWRLNAISDHILRKLISISKSDVKKGNSIMKATLTSGGVKNEKVTSIH